jgi:Domain of unknown function (DUF5666)
MFRTLLALSTLFSAACMADSASTSSSTSALTCFHTASSVVCAQGVSKAADSARTKVEDFYPSACFDGDADADGTPDFLDLDFLGSASASEPAESDELRCPRCNRGPGTQNDFRLRIEGSAGELERGKVFARSGGILTVPTPDGALPVAITSETRIEDGDPAPGAEIRVEGVVENGGLTATSIKVLCPAPAPLAPEDVPPDATPTQPGPPIIL